MYKAKELFRDAGFNILQDKPDFLVVLKDDIGIYISKSTPLCTDNIDCFYRVTLTFLGITDNSVKYNSEEEMLKRVKEIIKDLEN